MRNLLIAATVVVLLTAARPASAQNLRGFVFAGSTSDGHTQQYPAIGGGAVIDLGQPWLAVGAQGETFFQWPYFAGRGAVFAQGRIAPRSVARPFLFGGMGFGEDAGPVVGAGIEIGAPNTRLAFRLSIEDYMTRETRYSSPFQRRTEPRQQIATRIGISF